MTAWKRGFSQGRSERGRGINRHREAMWEIFWMLFHGQSKDDTFANIIGHGLGACEALELIRDTEREG